MKYLALFALIIFCSCKLKVTKGDSIANTTFYIEGNCHLIESGKDAVCAEYEDGAFTSVGVNTDCDALDTHYGAFNFDAHGYEFGTILLSCRSSNKIGLCSLTNKRIHYYSEEWTDAQAQTDCISLGGSYDG